MLNVQNDVYMHIFYNCKKLSCWGIEPMTSQLQLEFTSIIHFASRVHTKSVRVIVYIYHLTWRLVCPARLPPPSPIMTLPGRASTWISLTWKPRRAAKQALEARMWRPGALQPDHHQWTGKSQRLERWQVAVQLTPCRDFLGLHWQDTRIGGLGPRARQPACWSRQ